MRIFKDASGRSWEMRVNAGTVKRVADLLKVDLGKMTEGSPPLITRLHTDVMFIVDLLYVVLKPQLDAAEISDDGFYELLEGDVACDARDKLLEELVDFFQKLGQTTLARALQKQSEISVEAQRRGVAVLDGAEMADKLAAELGRIDGSLAPGSNAAS